MAITDEQKYLLNNKMGKVANQVSLGDLIEDAEEGGGLAAGAVDTTELAADAVTNAKIADDAVSVEHLDDGILPSHVVKFAAKYTTTGGGAAEAITVTGVAATDLVLVTLEDGGSSSVSVTKAVPTTDTVTVTFSADPGNDAIINYIVLRAAT